MSAKANISKCDVVNVVTVTATAAVTAGTLLIWGAWFGIALNDAAIGDDLSIDITPGEEITDTTSVSGVAASLGVAIYYNPTTDVYAAASATGYALVGYCTKILSSTVFSYEKVRYAAVA